MDKKKLIVIDETLDYRGECDLMKRIFNEARHYRMCGICGKSECFNECIFGKKYKLAIPESLRANIDWDFILKNKVNQKKE